MRMKLVVLAVVAQAAILAPTAAVARDYYGAIAYSQSTRAHGYSLDYRSRAGAEQKAYIECSKHAADCSIAVWFRNACGALAVGDDGGYGSGWHGTREGAENNAIKSCSGVSSGCRVIRWACTSR
jgi:Domain of unknown function (DUF4189)